MFNKQTVRPSVRPGQANEVSGRSQTSFPVAQEVQTQTPTTAIGNANTNRTKVNARRSYRRSNEYSRECKNKLKN